MLFRIAIVEDEAEPRKMLADMIGVYAKHDARCGFELCTYSDALSFLEDFHRLSTPCSSTFS